VSGRTKKLEWRRSQLKQMLRMLDEQKDALCEAVYKDLRKVGSVSRCLLGSSKYYISPTFAL